MATTKRADYTVNVQSNIGTRINLQAESSIPVTAGATVFAAATLFIGTAGNVTITSANGETGVLFKNLPSAFILPVLVTAVTAATASDLILLR